MKFVDKHVLFLLAIGHIVHVKCADSITVPLIDKLDAPLLASLDITSLNKQIRALIKNEVTNAIQTIVEEKVTVISERKLNETVEILDRKISQGIYEMKDRETVAITGCVQSRSFVKGYEIIKFPSIISQMGISDIAAADFKSTGKFVCKKAGLYHVSAVIVAEKKDNGFGVYKNTEVIKTMMLGLDLTGYRATTGVYMIHLDVGDTISIKVMWADNVYSHSCITIFRLQ